MKKSDEIKLTIIENYIDWFTSNEKRRKWLKESAYGYVMEDHVNEISQEQGIITVYPLHDSITEEILGTVYVKETEDTESVYDELFEAWTDFNKLEETDCDNESVDEFVVWFNENYVTQIERVFEESIHP